MHLLSRNNCRFSREFFLWNYIEFKKNYKLLNLCYENCDRFKQDFHPLLSAVNRSSINEYFKTPRGLGSNENAVLHCTSKYCGRSKHGKYNPNISSYLSDPIVTKSLGSMSRLSITSFIITSRTFGARVQLSDQ